MKRVFAALLATALLLSACVPKAPPPQPPPYQKKALEEYLPERTLTLPLYFLTADSARLAVEIRDIKVQDDQTVVQAILDALLQGPTADNLKTVLKSVKLEWAEISRDVANIDLSAQMFYPGTSGLEYEQDIIKARAMIANTICDALDVDYVNVSVVGREPGYSNVPLGSMKRLSTDLSIYLEQTKRTIIDNDYPMSRILTLYFPDKSGQYLLCETREIQLQDANSVDVVLAELCKGPRNTVQMQSLFDPKTTYTALAPPVDPGLEVSAEAASGLERLIVRFSDTPYVTPALASAAVVCSLMGFVPRIEGISVAFNRQAQIVAEDAFAMHSDYSDIIGTNIMLYYPIENAASLGALGRSIKQDLSQNPKVIVQELMKNAPKGYRNVFPEGVTQSDLLDALLCADMAIVNFRQEFYEKCKDMSEQDTVLMVYAIINTLTDIAGITRVQFLSNGNSIPSLHQIMLVNPLLRNPGLIE